MSMRVAIHQPNLFPRLKILQKLLAADVWVVLDSVQYCSCEWQNRTRLVASHGNYSSFWLTVPVTRPRGRSTLISDVKVVEPITTAHRLKRSIRHACRRAQHWSDIEGFMQSSDGSFSRLSLAQLCVDTTSNLLKLTGKMPEIIYASALQVEGSGSKLIAEIVRSLGAQTYLADSGARHYLNENDFRGIDLLWQRWEEPPEPSPAGCSWRDLSSINYLARYGVEAFSHHLCMDTFHICEAA